jgi:hypothetical protein
MPEHAPTPQQDIRIAETAAYAAKPEMDRAAEMRAEYPPVEGSANVIVDGQERLIPGNRRMDDTERKVVAAHEFYGMKDAGYAEEAAVTLDNQRARIAERIAARKTLNELMTPNRTATSDAEIRKIVA